MSYAFHDIIKILEAYLDDLATHSKKRANHPAHLRAIFDHCRKYKIRLNPLKCSFYVIAGRLLCFIVSKHGIMVDPLKVEVILQLSPPRTVRRLQSLQGKANFLWRFITNYVEIMKGFMCLLKKEVPFYWDDCAHRSFEALKKSLSEATIGMVLVQEDDSFHEDAIYYLSQSLIEAKLSYAHVEKLALVDFHTGQRLRYYLSLRKTYVVACLNPFQYILSCHMIDNKFAKWIVIL